MSDRRKVIITGASSGIGRATAIRFAEDGCDVCINARREPLLQELAAKLSPGNHLICPGDYGDPEVLENMRKTICDRWIGIDVLVNSAAMIAEAEVIDSPVEEWRRPLDTLIEGAVGITRMAVPLMSRGGRIIHITSIHGERVEPGFSAYGMAKAALNQYCRSLALELADRKILVNAIAPGYIDTPMSIGPDGTNELKSDWFRQNYIKGRHLPLRRPGQPEEVAGVASFLAGPDASYITGQVIAVDGGLNITF